jgi:hypothetical protein
VVKLATETARINAPFTEIVAWASGLPPGAVNVLTTCKLVLQLGSRSLIQRA